MNHDIGEAVGSIMDLFVIKSVKNKMNGMTITVMEAISTFCFRCSNIISLICNSCFWAVTYFVKMLFLFQILLIKTLFHHYLFGIFCHWRRYLVLGIIVSAPLFWQSPADISENHSCSFYRENILFVHWLVCYLPKLNNKYFPLYLIMTTANSSYWCPQNKKKVRTHLFPLIILKHSNASPELHTSDTCVYIVCYEF